MAFHIEAGNLIYYMMLRVRYGGKEGGRRERGGRKGGRKDVERREIEKMGGREGKSEVGREGERDIRREIERWNGVREGGRKRKVERMR